MLVPLPEDRYPRLAMTAQQQRDAMRSSPD
jgi:hypothetical protein